MATIDPFEKKTKYTPLLPDFFDESSDAPKGVEPEITSERTFGVELEMYGGSGEIVDFIRGQHTTAHDGSIKNESNNNDGCVEVQTSILKGKVGSKVLKDLMDKCTSLKWKTNGTCGTHVHLGGGDFFDKTKFKIGGLKDLSLGQTNILFEKKLINLMIQSRGNFDNVIKEIVGDISYVVDKPYTSEYKMATGKYSRYCVVPVMYFDQTYRFVIRESTLTKMGTSQKVLWNNDGLVLSSKGGKFTVKPEDVVLVYKQETEKFKKLKKLFYFYTIFDDVLFSMLPKERRSNNFCKRLSSSYSIRDIEKCQSQGELEKVWYQKDTYAEIERDKASPLQGHSNDSNNRDQSVRYHSTNFHSLYYKHGTVEIRMHHGTLNAQSLLLWVQLHQRIMDAVSNNETNDKVIIACSKGYTDVYEGGKLLIDALGIKGTNLEKFIKHRIKKYN